MKTAKIIVALALVLCMVFAVVACTTTTETEDPDATTTTAKEETPVTPGDDTPGDDTPGDDTPDTPDNVDIALVDAYGRTPVDPESIVAENFTPWAAGEDETHAFDGKYLEGDSTKIGGTSTGNIILTFKTLYPVSAKYYVLVTGNDTADNPGRNPSSWILSGSTDGNTWTELDAVSNTGLEAVDYTPFAYEIDTPAQYSYYQISITCDPGAFQLNEIMIMGPKTHNVDIDTTEFTKAEIDATSINAEGINPWGDGENASKIFDGDAEGTKLGGGVPEKKFTLTFNTTAPFIVNYYTLVTGGDSATWTGRNPIAWTFYGSNDGENWKQLDQAITDDTNIPGLYDADATPFTFKVAIPNAYTNYKIEFETAGDSFQLNEIELYAAKALNTTDDVSALTVATVNADSIAKDGISPWGDGENETKLFDGDLEGTKLGGNVSEEKTFFVTFQTETAVTAKYYAITTGNDSGTWTGRNPICWELSGSADGTTYTAISTINPGATEVTGLLDADHVTFNYAIDEANQAEYQFYKITFYTEGGAFQLNELQLLY